MQVVERYRWTTNGIHDSIYVLNDEFCGSAVSIDLDGPVAILSFSYLVCRTSFTKILGLSATPRVSPSASPRPAPLP